LVSTHEPPHNAPPLGHAQRPAWQACPAAQVTPQAPQLARLVEVSTHALPHFVSEPHDALVEHPLGVHNWLLAHFTPQP
jgi:hypothetical protein